jgi:hypothetical protein
MSYLEISDLAGGRQVPVGAYFTIGRATSNHVRLYGNTISRRHARIVCQGGGAVLEDLGSTHGTLVNGRYVAGWRTLQDGDFIQVGEARMIYRQTSPVARHEAVTPMHLARPILDGRVALAPNMVRCPFCGTHNLKSNSVCYNCGASLIRKVRTTAPGAAGATQAGRSLSPGRSGGAAAATRAMPGWPVVALVVVMVVLMCLLCIMLGLMLAGMAAGL